ncbi:hypothetical protein [Paraglaciecola psychrophila]|uniref:Fibronectin type-III domain-containing protein n=1 Tax=Paraglaciecola psychrophila 170 TaxID=1129794 RepID=K6ZLI9_9ALTE|nr:hypothetical protein [Paraglaciecola psychrophila]AGH44523.1 hypothetical protein C427_2414 [Paraglaciecola psychrophila 170]GAC36801.1 hypothetical protein GPSY_1164 [Paraglaciecola psychrophila 170]
MAIISGLKRTATKLGQLKASPQSMGTNNGVFLPKSIKGYDIPNWPSQIWHTVILTSTDHDDASNTATGGNGGLWLLAIKGDPALSANWQYWDDISGNAEFAYLFSAEPATPTSNPIFVDTAVGYQTETFDVINVGGTLTLTYHNSGNNNYNGFETQNTVRATSTDGINYTRQGIILDYNPRYLAGDGHTGYFNFGVNPFPNIPYSYIGNSIFGGGADERNGGRMLWGSNDLIVWDRVHKYDTNAGRLSDSITTGGEDYIIGLTMFHAAVREGAYWRIPVVAKLRVFGTSMNKVHAVEILIDDNLNVVSEPKIYIGLGSSSTFDEGSAGNTTEFMHEGVLYGVYDASDSSNIHSFGLVTIVNEPTSWTLLNPRLSVPSTIYDYDLRTAESVPSDISVVNGTLSTVEDGRLELAVSNGGESGRLYTDIYVTPSDYNTVDFVFDGLRTNSSDPVTRVFGLYSNQVINSNIDALNVVPTISNQHSPLQIQVFNNSAVLRNEVTTMHIGFERSWLDDKEESPQAEQTIALRLIPAQNIGYLLHGSSEVETLDLSGYNFDTPVVMGMGMTNSAGAVKTFGMSRITATSYANVEIAVPAAPAMTATAGNTEIAFSCPTIAEATGYKAFVGRNGVYNESDLGDSNTGTVTGLTNDIEFTVFMRAYNEEGESAPTATQVVTPIATATSTANITITGIPKGDHYIYLNDDTHTQIHSGLVTFAAEAATITALPLLVGARYYGYWKGSNTPTDGSGITGITV